MYIQHSSSLGGFDILHSNCKNFSFTPHSHDEIVIAAYIKGQKHYKCHRSEGIALPGDLLLIGSDVVHSARSIKDFNWQYISVYLTLGQICTVTGLTEQEINSRCGSHLMLQSLQGGKWKGRELLESLDEPDDNNRELVLSIFLVELMAELRRNKKPKNVKHNKISLVYELIREESEKNYSLEHLSEQAEVSREHLCREFKATYGLTLSQLRGSVRTEKARNYIQSGYSLADVASMTNFSDQSHMNRWFNKIYGVPPGQFVIHQ